MNRCWSFRALDFTFKVDCGIDSLHDALDVLLGGYQSTSDPVPSLFHYKLESAAQVYRLYRDGTDCFEGSSQELLEFFQIDIYRRIVENTKQRWLLHAAAVCKNNKVVVLAGPSNAGKSTLCRALIRTGWQYLSEEIVSLRGCSIDALRRPLYLEEPGQASDLGSENCHQMSYGESPLWIAQAPAWPKHLRLQDLRLAALIRLQYRPEIETYLQPLDDSQAREVFWDCRMNTGMQVAQLAADVIAASSCYHMHVADSQSAMQRINALVETRDTKLG